MAFKNIVVTAFKQVYHLMNYDVLKAFQWLLGQFQVDPNPRVFCVAATPLGFHTLHAPLGDRAINRRLPLTD